MVAALAFSALASRYRSDISKSDETLGMLSPSTLHTKDAEYLVALVFFLSVMELGLSWWR